MVTVPCLLALPQVLVVFLRASGTCTPYVLGKKVEEFIGAEGDGTGAQPWQLVLDWCAAATQTEPGGGSVVAMGVEAPLSEDEGFLRWCTQKLDGCLGSKTHVRQPAVHGGQQTMIAAANMVNQMGRTVLSGFQALAPVFASRNEGGGGTRDGATSVGGFGKQYTPANVAQLMGFCGVEKAREIPPVWGVFQNRTT